MQSVYLGNTVHPQRPNRNNANYGMAQSTPTTYAPHGGGLLYTAAATTATTVPSTTQRHLMREYHRASSRQSAPRYKPVFLANLTWFQSKYSISNKNVSNPQQVLPYWPACRGICATTGRLRTSTDDGTNQCYSTIDLVRYVSC